jgi:hypothetical protein
MSLKGVEKRVNVITFENVSGHQIISKKIKASMKVHLCRRI